MRAAASRRAIVAGDSPRARSPAAQVSRSPTRRLARRPSERGREIGEVTPVCVYRPGRAAGCEQGEKARDLRVVRLVDGHGRRPGAGAVRRRGCKPAWWRATRGRAAPGSCGGRRRPRAGGWRTHGAGDAGSAPGGAASRCPGACLARTGTHAPWRARASLGRPSVEVAVQPVRGLLAERDDALLVPLAENPQRLLLEVDVGQRAGRPPPGSADRPSRRARRARGCEAPGGRRPRGRASRASVSRTVGALGSLRRGAPRSGTSGHVPGPSRRQEQAANG